MSLANIVGQLDMDAVREHYLHRERTHRELRGLLEAGEIHEFVQLALGISSDTGNYSAAEHGLGPRILAESNETAVFRLATEIEACPTSRRLPQVIYQHSVPFLKISVGSEIAMMLKPAVHWVGNVRTIWSDLLVRNDGDANRANQALTAFRAQERDGEMPYDIWRDLYLALEQSLSELGRVGSVAANAQSVPTGTLRFMWPDALASHLFDRFAEHVATRR
ncbi:MAG: hypothetical protein L0Y44_16435 [Phycisphaerales bacterium]|nr:hypothetical protein [Phycisphaerales bacterium]